MKNAMFAVMMLMLSGCAEQKQVTLTPIWPAIHELQAQVAQQRKDIDELKRQLSRARDGNATATGDCSVADTGSGNVVSYYSPCPPKHK